MRKKKSPDHRRAHPAKKGSDPHGKGGKPFLMPLDKLGGEKEKRGKNINEAHHNSASAGKERGILHHLILVSS